MSERIDLSEVKKHLHDDMTIMIGGFLGVGTPEALVDEVLKSGVKNLTIIGNDTAFPGVGIGRLVVAGLVKSVYVDHIGTNKVTVELKNSNKIEVNLVPQGTLAEKIQAAASGLGGFYTATGVGTWVEEGKTDVGGPKESKVINGKKYILEYPLHADLALILAHKADKYGNLVYSKTARNFNPMMAMAAKKVIAFAKNTVDVLDPETIITPHLFVDYVVEGSK